MNKLDTRFGNILFMLFNTLKQTTQTSFNTNELNFLVFMNKACEIIRDILCLKSNCDFLSLIQIH